MNKAVSRTLGVILAASLPFAAAADDIDRTLDADPDGKVSVSNLAGSVEVAGWKRNQVHVTGSLGDDVEDFVFVRSGRSTTIKVKAPERSWGRKDVSSDLMIRVPMGSSLDISTVSADIEIEGVTGEQDLQSVSGDIKTEAFAADIQAETVSGDVDLSGDGKDGEWDLSSVSGDITCERVSGDMDAEVVSGDIEVLDGSFDRVKLETVNGDIRLNAGLRKDGKIDIESVNGSVDLEFVGKVSARFDVETFNGRIKNCFGPKAERANRYAPGWELNFSEGGGNGRVSIATLNGGVTICNKD